MTNAPKLLPCPFCGGLLAWSDLYRDYHHPVTKCILSRHKFKKGVIMQWNRRAVLATPEALSEAPEVQALIAEAVEKATRIKPLVWRSNGKGRICADTSFGAYEVEHGRYGMRLLHGGSFMQDDLQGIAAAKAAAQADYEQRIRAAIGGTENE